MTIAPNPNNGRFELIISNQKEDFVLEIYNALGMLVDHQNIESKKQSHSLQLNLPKEIYYLKISDHHSIVKKLVIDKSVRQRRFIDILGINQWGNFVLAFCAFFKSHQPII